MKTITLKPIIIGFSFAFAFVSCNKEDDIINRNTGLLIDKSWKFEIYGLDENNNGIIEESENYMLTCEADDIFTFFANGGGIYEGGATPCSIGEPHGEGRSNYLVYCGNISTSL